MLQPEDYICPKMVTKIPKLLFHLPERGLALKAVGIFLYDISCNYGQICTCQDGLCLPIILLISLVAD